MIRRWISERRIAERRTAEPDAEALAELEALAALIRRTPIGRRVDNRRACQ